MDEVAAMTHAGESVGRAMGTGLRSLRRGATQVGQAGAEAAARAATAAERKLAASGQEAAKELVATTRRARRDLARASAQAGREASRTAARRLHELADTLPGQPRKRRRWPWLVAFAGLAAAGSAAAVVLRSRGTGDPAMVEEAADDTDQQRIAGNGTAPRPRTEQKELDHKN